MHAARSLLLALGFAALSAPLRAQEVTEPAVIHGFASWSYGRTSQNNYLAGTPEGDFRHVSLAINLAKQLNDKLTIHAQLFTRRSADNAETTLDYAFADYKVDDHLSLHVGQVKHPFGIYTEVFDVGTLRPFLDLPQGVYGLAGFAGESYTGIGASGTRDAGAWSVLYDVYAGGNEVDRFVVPGLFYGASAPQSGREPVRDQSNRNVVGGRVVLKTPLHGLSLGSSSYTGTIVGTAATRFTVIAGQVAYRTNALTLESEIAHAAEVSDEQTTGGYALAAYRLTPEWQVAAQYDNLTSRFAHTDVTAAPSLQNHREAAFAISRWMTRAVVLKAEYHRVSGNRFATPNQEDLDAIVAAKDLRVITHLFQFGAQFSF